MWAEAVGIEGLGHVVGVPSLAHASMCSPSAGTVFGGTGSAILRHGFSGATWSIIGWVGLALSAERLLAADEACRQTGVEGTGLNLRNRVMVGKMHFGMASWRRLLELSSPVCAIAGRQL